jgi:hypothetical protein
MFKLERMDCYICSYAICSSYCNNRDVCFIQLCYSLIVPPLIFRLYSRYWKFISHNLSHTTVYQPAIRTQVDLTQESCHVVYVLCHYFLPAPISQQLQIMALLRSYIPLLHR